MEVENKYYQIYVDDILDLASSIVLKWSDAATLMNQWVLGYTNDSFDEHDPRTWKYYLNLSGEYFETDTPMLITSLDSLEEIVFSKSNLEFHRATKKAYAFGTTYYKELVEKYPDQEDLIRGILYPADMAVAIAAADGQILAYPPVLVEATEPSLIPNLQDWLNGFVRRWHNAQYQNTDNLYLSGMLTVLYATLPGAIENIRQGMTLTHEVHSYHVRQYLASHSKLDRYLPYMTRSQAMFFYHNLAYIENNNGRQEIFDELLKRTFTERRLPMAHFSMAHSTAGMPESLLPVVVFEKKPLNTEVNMDGRNQFSLNDVLNIEDQLVPANALYRDDEQPKIEEAGTYTLDPNIPTKLLQTTVVDYTDSERYRLADIVLQHWLWLGHTDYYQAYVSFTIPANGNRLSLTPIDAFVFYVYALVHGMNWELDHLPTVSANRVQRVPLATLASMREVCEVKQVSDAWLLSARATMPAVQSMISLEAFRNHCQAVFEAANEQYGMIALEERMTARAQKEAAVCRLWGDERFVLGGDKPGQNYAEWFAERNIVVKDLSNAQLAEVAHVILAEATGVNLTSTITLKDIQRAMAGILTDLSSYSIQIALDINTGPVLNAGFTQVRMDDLDIETSQNIHYEIPTVDPWNIKTQGESTLLLDLNKFPTLDVVTQEQSCHMEFLLPHVKLSMPGDSSITISRRYGVKAKYDCIVDMTDVDNPRNLTIVPGMEEFLKLPLDVQQSSYVDTWAR